MRFALVLKKACDTCQLVGPLVKGLQARNELVVYSQDDPFFPADAEVIDDSDLERSWRWRIETVPTLILFDDAGSESRRLVGWDKAEWEDVTGSSFSENMPTFRPGCGSRTQDPGMPEKLTAKFDAYAVSAREISLGEGEDQMEACFDRGWSDGLPLIPPTRERVLRMLSGSSRQADEVVGLIPPDLVSCTIEKIAINAVMAGCKPEYMPVVIATVEAALQEEFCMHGLLATTYFSGPLVIVNGPVSRRIGMNSKGNTFGQGNRANATIGRALQLVVRNVGGGKPGGVDRSVFGNPGKYTFCFAEDELGSCWESLAVERGFTDGASTVTLFAADGVQGVVDQKSRDPESLCRSFAASLRTVGHAKMIMAADAILVISPEHERVFRLAGWSKQQVRQKIMEILQISGGELVAGAGGISEGIPETLKDATLSKFRDGGLHIVRAGGSAGMFSAIIAGWAASGSIGSTMVTREIEE